MKIIPAIDLKNNKCVRLLQGDYNQVTQYENSPVEQAKLWEDLGAKLIHIVDLDGAKHGIGKNYNVIKDIINNINVPVEVGGGIRTLETVESLLKIGVKYIILGTAAVKDEVFLKEVLKKYPENITVGIDAKNDFVSIAGWIENTNLDYLEFAKKICDLGCKRIIYTDISRDGMLTSPNFEKIKKIANTVDVEIIASGGIARYEDITGIQKLNCKNIKGIITGKALYEKKIELDKAIELIGNEKC